MRSVNFDARYETFVYAQVALLMRAVGRDIKRRGRGDAPTIPDNFVNPAAEGSRALLVVGPEKEVLAAGVVPARRRNKIAKRTQS